MRGRKRRIRRQERVGSVAADLGNLDSIKKAGREAQGTQGLSKNYASRECIPFIALDQRFSLLVSLIPPWRIIQCEWKRRARRTVPDCAVMCSLINREREKEIERERRRERRREREREDSVGSVDIDQGYLENINK